MLDQWQVRAAAMHAASPWGEKGPDWDLVHDAAHYIADQGAATCRGDMCPWLRDTNPPRQPGDPEARYLAHEERCTRCAAGLVCVWARPRFRLTRDR